MSVSQSLTVRASPTLFVHGEASQDDILVRAAAAVYQAKAQGRNRVLFYVAQTEAN